MHALTPNPGPELDQFLEERLKKPAENISELFNSRKVFGADAASTSLMGTSSEFFELRAEAYIGSGRVERSEEHTSELQSLMRISYAVFCLKKKKTQRTHTNTIDI